LCLALTTCQTQPLLQGYMDLVSQGVMPGGITVSSVLHFLRIDHNHVILLSNVINTKITFSFERFTDGTYVMC